MPNPKPTNSNPKDSPYERGTTEGQVRTSDQIQRMLLADGITCSVSHSGNVWDNLAMESAFSSLKTERTSRKIHRARHAARADVFDDIERS